MKNILIIGGTGKIGRRVTRRLQADGRPVRTASRTGGDIPFDLADPATWAPALDGVIAVERALGRPPRTFEAYVTETAAAGHWNRPSPEAGAAR